MLLVGRNLLISTESKSKKHQKVELNVQVDISGDQDRSVWEGSSHRLLRQSLTGSCPSALGIYGQGPVGYWWVFLANTMFIRLYAFMLYIHSMSGIQK